jgi:hypothetical protein
VKHTRIFFAVAALAFVSACGDDGPNDPSNFSGTVSFAYTGAGGGNFNVSGAAPALSANFGGSNWAAGSRDDAANQVGLVAVRTRSGGRYDVVYLGINRVTVGSSTVQANCDPDLGENCSGLVFFTNIADTDDEYDFFCFATSGTMAITSISDTRAEGTFTGGGTCISGAPGGGTSTFAITNGAFNVRLLAESQLPQ